jgi:hypothetical protein
MNERTFRRVMSSVIASVRPDPVTLWHQQKAGKLCRACEGSLPKPHTSGLKYCEYCTGRQLVMFLFSCAGSVGHCRFTTVDRKQVIRRVCFRDEAKVCETVRRGNGLMTRSEGERLQVAIDIGRGRILLRLSDTLCGACALLRGRSCDAPQILTSGRNQASGTRRRRSCRSRLRLHPTLPTKIRRLDAFAGECVEVFRALLFPQNMSTGVIHAAVAPRRRSR